MTLPAKANEVVLADCNQQLADLLGLAPLDLTTGGAHALQDRLWVWGVLGGKEVGKSTLINAIAGDSVVDLGDPVGEGTFQPAAYCHPQDEAELRERLKPLDGINVTFHCSAPPSMQGLVLIDLPDFDSVFAHHVDQVRRISTVLDGIIWITTPKKVGDLRAIREIRRVLKDRANFAYVLNKMDWLITQSDGDPKDSIERASRQLTAQIEAGDADPGRHGGYLIAARYPDRDQLRRALGHANAPSAAAHPCNGEIEGAVDRLTADFESLRTELTSPRTEEAYRSRKQANLDYQLTAQGRRLLEYYRPQSLLNRLDRAVHLEDTSDRVREFLSESYCAQLLSRLNDEDVLLTEWSAKLFKRRIACWPLLGMVAWPLILIGAAINRIRTLWPGAARAGEVDDPFRADGIALSERMEAVIAAQRSALGGLTKKLSIELPSPEQLESMFRTDTLRIANTQQQAVIDQLMRRTAGPVGRLVRGAIAAMALLWFPILQPILQFVLAGFGTASASQSNPSRGAGWGALAAEMVGALSASRVLAGLMVSLMLVIALVAMVYSRAVRDAQRAIDSLSQTQENGIGGALIEPVAQALNQPVASIRDQLQAMVEKLQRLDQS